MTEPPMHELLEAGRGGGVSPLKGWRTRLLPGAARNKIELSRVRGGPALLLEGRWLRTVSICFSAGERWVAASGYAGGVTVWNTDTGAAVASFPEIEAEAAGDGRLPLLFALGDGLLVCGGPKLTFIDTQQWTKVRVLPQPGDALLSLDDSRRLAVFEFAESGCTRWVLNVKSLEIEGADRLRETRIYFGLLRGNRSRVS